MIKFKKIGRPEWLKRRLGYVADRIGSNGKIEIDSKNENRVILRLTNADGIVELIPASVALSELIVSGSVKIDDLKTYEVLELSSGYICVSQLAKGISVEDLLTMEVRIDPRR